jgi:hypothetical protein
MDNRHQTRRLAPIVALQQSALNGKGLEERSTSETGK